MVGFVKSVSVCVHQRMCVSVCVQQVLERETESECEHLIVSVCARIVFIPVPYACVLC